METPEKSIRMSIGDNVKFVEIEGKDFHTIMSTVQAAAQRLLAEMNDEIPNTWKRYEGLPKELKTTEELTGHDVSGT